MSLLRPTPDESAVLVVPLEPDEDGWGGYVEGKMTVVWPFFFLKQKVLLHRPQSLIPKGSSAILSKRQANCMVYFYMCHFKISCFENAVFICSQCIQEMTVFWPLFFGTKSVMARTAVAKCTGR